MPPKAKITKDMIIDAAFTIARMQGAENINARMIAEKLGCSTQPVMYCFSTIEEIKKAVYAKADAFHTAYITNLAENDTGLTMGLLYIKFAATESYLFRFLFQSNEFSGKNMMDLIDADELAPVIAIMQKSTGLDIEQTKKIFLSVFLFVHGYASMFANNKMTYNEAAIASELAQAYTGAVYAITQTSESSYGQEAEIRKKERGHD